jgi:hypothetical protein
MPSSGGSRVTHRLSRNPILFVIYAFLVAFMTYSCMYGFRKPFTVGTYFGLTYGRISFKIFIITAQMIGYTISKFSGIIFISGLRRHRRGMWIVTFIGIAEAALIGFGAAPLRYKPLFMFVNGLPLGLIWGLVFSFIEGRRQSDFLTTGMCISFIVASGAAKAVGKLLVNWGVAEMWMPAAAGAVFFPPLLLGAYLLELLPEPSEDDIRVRTERVPMTGYDRVQLLRTFAPGICLMTLLYMILSAARDFRDNFAPELWHAFGYRAAPSLFAVSEVVVGLVVTVPILVFMTIKSHIRTLVAYHLLIVTGMVLTGATAALYASGMCNGLVFMIISGICLHLAYVPFSNIIFELILAVFRYKANSGFLMYLCDSLGYLSSVAVIMVRNFAMPHLAWDHFYVAVNYWLAGTGTVLMSMSLMYYFTKYRGWGTVDAREPPLLESGSEKGFEEPQRSVEFEAVKITESLKE